MKGDRDGHPFWFWMIRVRYWVDHTFLIDTQGEPLQKNLYAWIISSVYEASKHRAVQMPLGGLTAVVMVIVSAQISQEMESIGHGHVL